MGNIKRGRHYVYTLNYHIVWTPRYRKSVLLGAVADTSRALKKEFEALQRIYWGNSTLWAKSYYIGSAGHVSAETIKYYIEESQNL